MQLTFTAGFGGGATSALILMRPDEAPINMFTYRIDVIWTIVWWTSNYFPYNIPGRIIRLPPVKLACKLLALIAAGSIMCTRVDQVLKFYPDATIAALLVGAPPPHPLVVPLPLQLSPDCIPGTTRRSWLSGRSHCLTVPNRA